MAENVVFGGEFVASLANVKVASAKSGRIIHVD